MNDMQCGTFVTLLVSSLEMLADMYTVSFNSLKGTVRYSVLLLLNLHSAALEHGEDFSKTEYVSL